MQESIYVDMPTVAAEVGMIELELAARGLKQLRRVGRPFEL